MKKKVLKFLAIMLAAVLSVGVLTQTITLADDWDDIDWDDFDWDDWGDWYDDDDDVYGDYTVDNDIYAYLTTTVRDYDFMVGDSTVVNANLSTNATSGYDIRWSSSNPGVASVSGGGNYAYVNGISAGSAYITASVYINGNQYDSDSVQVTVMAPKQTPQAQTRVGVSGISISSNSISLQAGGSYKLTAFPTPENATNRGITWGSNNTNVATVDQDGTVHAINSGNVIITARTNENGYTATCNVAVTGGANTAAVQSVAVNPTSITIGLKQAFLITPTVYPLNAANKTVSFTSSNPAIASVNANGYVTGLKEGVAIITCMTNDGGRIAQTTVTVGKSVTAPISATSTRDPMFLYQVTKMILEAPKNGTVTLPVPMPLSFDVNVATALKTRPDVKIVATYPFQGHTFCLTIPAGYNLSALLDAKGYVEWLNLVGRKDGVTTTVIN